MYKSKRATLEQASVACRRYVSAAYLAARRRAEFLKPSTKLTAGQWAFLHRIGLEELSQAKTICALSHPSVVPENQAEFAKLKEAGEKCVRFFSVEYTRARFPQLHFEGFALATAMYRAPANLAALAKSFGIDEAIKFPLPEARKHGMLLARDAPRQDLAAQKEKQQQLDSACAESFLALLGALYMEKDSFAVRKFLDERLFTCTFDKDLLCSPKNSPQLLERFFRFADKPEPQYRQPLQPLDSSANPYVRLLRETGRLSNSSMFLVGVFSGSEKIGEGYGASLALAEHRAATDALRKLYLEEAVDFRRPSDRLALSDIKPLSLIGLEQE